GSLRTNLRKYELDDDQWVLATQLREVLKIFYDATQFFSRDEPTLSEVLPAMDTIDEYLTTTSLDKKFQPSIRAAVNLAKKTMNRYYSKTDQSECYRIAMILDPNHKLDYFKNNAWPDDWIETA
ncbi:hypothetical protein BC629DRAFT_1254460, partial [Irpex lacteus]